jgi:hypothetical protein
MQRVVTGSQLNHSLRPSVAQIQHYKLNPFESVAGNDSPNDFSSGESGALGGASSGEGGAGAGGGSTGNGGKAGPHSLNTSDMSAGGVMSDMSAIMIFL